MLPRLGNNHNGSGGLNFGDASLQARKTGNCNQLFEDIEAGYFDWHSWPHLLPSPSDHQLFFTRYILSGKEPTGNELGGDPASLSSVAS